MIERLDSMENLVRDIADDLTLGCKVYYNIETRECFGALQETIIDYVDYIDIKDDEFEKVLQEEISHGMIDFVRDLREGIRLGDHIEPPTSYEKFQWMEDFVDECSNFPRFVSQAHKALSSRHPFGAFKNAVYSHGMQKSWYAFESERMRDYVRHELNLA